MNLDNAPTLAAVWVRMLPGSPMEAIGAGYRWRLLVLAIGEAPKLVRCILREEEMADKTRSDSDAALNKRGTLSVKTKMQQPFDLDSFLSHADAGRTKAKYRKNETIFRQGDSADAVFYIMDGKCKVTVVSEKGKEAVVALHEKGDFFGEGCLTGQPRRLATVIAITMSEMMRFDKATMVRALHDEPKFSELFMSHLLTRNVRVEADLVDQLFNSSEKRLARLLLLMANFGKEGRPEPVIAKVSQETLAEMIGTTRSRVSFFMNKFRKLGFIDYNGGLEVHSSLLNVVLHETPGITKNPARQKIGG